MGSELLSGEAKDQLAQLKHNSTTNMCVYIICMRSPLMKRKEQ